MGTPVPVRLPSQERIGCSITNLQSARVNEHMQFFILDAAQFCTAPAVQGQCGMGLSCYLYNCLMRFLSFTMGCDPREEYPRDSLESRLRGVCPYLILNRPTKAERSPRAVSPPCRRPELTSSAA